MTKRAGPSACPGFYKATAAREMKGVSSDLQDAIDEAMDFWKS